MPNDCKDELLGYLEEIELTDKSKILVLDPSDSTLLFIYSNPYVKSEFEFSFFIISIFSDKISSFSSLEFKFEALSFLLFLDSENFCLANVIFNLSKTLFDFELIAI